MKATLYLQYTSRSLRRGGQRTLLAICCLTVGVMAIVSLQLVGYMLQNSLAGSARLATGGDLAINAQGAPLRQQDLAFFDQLERQGTISDYTAIIGASGAFSNMTSATQTFPVEAVNSSTFPLVGAPDFVAPPSATLASLLSGQRVVVTQQFLTLYQRQVGQSFPLYLKTLTGTGETLQVTIAGVIANSGAFAQAGNLMLISQADYLAAAPARLAYYTQINITTPDQAHSDQALKAITARFPQTSTQTASDLFRGQQATIDAISQFLKIAGLIALLIGGVGIANTMQVLLSRRRTEIAMLKTAGYQRQDLYTLFGLEAGLLGLISGIAGTLSALGLSFLVRQLLQRFGTSVPFVIDGRLLLGGALIGCATALIFGLLPIAQAASIRPLQVLREISERHPSDHIMTFLLSILLSILFCMLTTVVLSNNLILGILVTYGTFAFLLVLSGIFSLLVLAMSKLPVPEGLHPVQLLLVLIGVALSLLLFRTLPVFSAFLLLLSLLGLVIPWLPRRWKVTIKMALRNIGRRRTRTVATMLALFIGVAGVGLDIGMGQDLQARVTAVLNQQQPYNLVVTTNGSDRAMLAAHLQSIKGLSASRLDLFAQTLPLLINGRPARMQMPGGDYGQQVSAMLGGIEGFDLTRYRPTPTIIAGRNLNASDRGTNHILISAIMTRVGWAGLHLKPGDSVTFASLDDKSVRTATIVGVFSIPDSYQTLGKVLAPDSLVTALSPAGEGQTAIFYLQVPSSQVATALKQVERLAPSASAQNLTDGAASFLQQVRSFTDLLLAISLLSLLAGVIIVANSVALAMLERQREVGILKTVGYTARGILGQIVLENALVGGVGAFCATLLAASGVVAFSKVFFNNNLILSMEPAVTIALIVGPVLLACATATLVAWRAARVRPLIVLRYE